MIESKYIFLFVLLSGILFQYFKYKNAQNQKFVSYLTYFEELSMVKKEFPVDLKFLVGFESIKYYIFKNFTSYNDIPIQKSICFSEIQNEEDLQCTLFKAKRNTYNSKHFVMNETLFRSMIQDVSKVYSQRLSGSGVNFARQLAYLKNTNVLLASKIEKSSLKLLPNNVKVAVVLEDKKLGLRKYGVIAFYSENHKAIFNRAGFKTILEDLDLINNQLLQEFSPHCFVISRFPLFRDDFIERVANKIKDFSNILSSLPTGLVVHHQLGIIDNLEAGRLLIKQFIPHLDSIDLGLMELHQLHSIVRQGDLNTSSYTSDIETNLSVLDDLWTIINSGSLSATKGTRVLSRIHLRAHDYHILMVESQTKKFYKNLKHALAKGIMAQLHSRCNRKLKILKEIVHFHLEDEFFLSRNLTESPIQCWTQSRAYEICVSPIPTCFDLKHPLEDGESTGAATLAAQIRIPE